MEISELNPTQENIDFAAQERRRHFESTTDKQWRTLSELRREDSRRRKFKRWAKELAGLARYEDSVETYVDRAFNTGVTLQRNYGYDEDDGRASNSTGPVGERRGRIQVVNLVPNTDAYRHAILWAVAAQAVAERTNHHARGQDSRWAHELADMLDEELTRKDLCAYVLTDEYVAELLAERETRAITKAHHLFSESPAALRLLRTDYDRYLEVMAHRGQDHTLTVQQLLAAFDLESDAEVAA